ncbi:2-oxoadipate dioxygenase/decarboxylase HglS [Kordiimonas pumila]|uniref:2-oxoadipate dioxygenase/decarboxylase n=1 Tax=Kordiimonas pumila TaxID=2161677 RepID=A0ABV7D9L9_9PROT|nr:VOC family protein [Kordiimonas pumila]
MTQVTFISPSEIRAKFSAAMSAMYRTEVPTYGTLLDMVSSINHEMLSNDAALHRSMEVTGQLDRISEERHGAIRLGKPEELFMMRRLFAVMGMEPVGYYDLSPAGIPVHSTAFRPVADADLQKNPFRVFTSLLRLDLIPDQNLRESALATVEQRDIFTAGVKALIEKAERQKGLSETDAYSFIAEALETFRWHEKANVSEALYHQLHDAHRLIADVVSFKGPHINHLTPCTLDIDMVQKEMPRQGITPKAVVEGPPTRKCAILLRQTSFKALNEKVAFLEGENQWKEGYHTARFGEIEQRGCALTQKGRALYDKLLAKTRTLITPKADGSNAEEYRSILAKTFQEFPDTYAEMRKQGLAFFRYSVTRKGKDIANTGGEDGSLDDLIKAGLVRFDPLTYEDFLPVSAAGIFQSNLGDNAANDFAESPNQKLFEEALGAPVISEFGLYETAEEQSKQKCKETLKPARAA